VYVLILDMRVLMYATSPEDLADLVRLKLDSGSVLQMRVEDGEDLRPLTDQERIEVFRALAGE